LTFDLKISPPLCILVLTGSLLSAHFAWAESATLAGAQQQAQQLKLANDAQWQALLHYHNQRSLVTDEAFFFILTAQKTKTRN